MRFIKWNRRTVLFAVVAVLALGVSGVAVAQSMNKGPRTDRTGSGFQLQVVNQNTKQCTGQDGEYSEQVHAEYEGTSDSPDPRLNGELFVTVDSLVRETPKVGDPGTLGIADGHFRIKQGNRVSAEGDFYATVEGPAPGAPTRIVGTAVGRVTGMAQEVGGELVGSFRASASPGGAQVRGQFGGAGEASLPAVIQQGSCFGPAEQTP